MFGIPKPVKQEWSSCQLDFVKEFILHNESDVAKLPACCVGSKATVSETNNRYVCCKDGTWKLESTAVEEGTGEGGGTGGGGGVQLDWNQSDETKPNYVKNRTHYKEVVNLTIINETELPFIGQIESGDFIYDASSLLEELGNIDRNYANEIMHGSYPVTIKFNGETSDLFFYNDEMSFGSYSDYAAGTIPFIAKIRSGVKLDLYTKIQAESATASAFCTIENFKRLDSRYLPYNVPLIDDDGMLPSRIVPKMKRKFSCSYMTEMEQKRLKQMEALPIMTL